MMRRIGEANFCSMLIVSKVLRNSKFTTTREIIPRRDLPPPSSLQRCSGLTPAELRIVATLEPQRRRTRRRRQHRSQDWDQTAALAARRHGAVDLLGRLDDMHPGERGRN